MRAIVSGMAIMLALALPAHAERNDELWVGGATRALRTASANALTDDSLAGTAFGYGREVAVLGPALTLWAEAGVAVSAASGWMFRTMSTQLDVVDLTGGLRVRYQLRRWLAAGARFDAGAQRVDLEILDSSGAARGGAWGVTASSAVALDVLAVAGRRFGLGVRTELGYVAAQARSLALHRDIGGDVLPLAMTDAPFGHLDLSGAAFGISVIGQF